MKHLAAQLAGLIFVAISIALPALPQSSAKVPADPVHTRMPYQVRAGAIHCVVWTEYEGIKPLIPCAWEQAKAEMYRRFPSLAEQSAEPVMPKMEYHKGLWYDRHEQTMVAGETTADRVKIAVTGDLDDSFDTLVHEFKHWWVKQTIQRPAQFLSGLWVDLVNSTWKEDCQVISPTASASGPDHLR